jgi:hypothetical protein
VQFQPKPSSVSNTKIASPSPSPSPPPLTESHKYWDAALKSFLAHLGLAQALRGFELDMLVINSDWERSKVPGAVADLVRDLSVSIWHLYFLWTIVPATSFSDGIP